MRDSNSCGRGIIVMRIRPRLGFISLLVPLLLGHGAEASAQDAHAHIAMPAKAAATCATRWSDPASWPNGKVPGEGDAVTIAKDKSIVLDVSPPALRSLTVNGKLAFAPDRDLSLTTEWIYLS